MRSPITLNAWQRKAQEQWPFGVWEKIGGGFYRAVHLDVAEGPKMNERTLQIMPADRYLSLPTILEHLTYERQECELCSGTAFSISKARVVSGSVHFLPAAESCPACNGTGLDPDYRKAQEWAERLELEDG